MTVQSKNICSIMQPTYLPWAGYFSLMSSSDQFVFLDDVQLSKQSWQTRNQINANGKEQWLSVPVFHKSSDQLIKDTQIDDRTKWRDKQIKTIQMNYQKSNHFHDVKYVFDIISDKTIQNLSNLNIKLIAETCKLIQLGTKIHLSSQMQDKLVGRSKRLIDICQKIGCGRYLSPVGAKEYLLDDDFSKNDYVQVSIFSFTPQMYEQPKTQAFISHLSFVDVIANISLAGFKDYIQDSKSIKIESLT